MRMNAGRYMIRRLWIGEVGDTCTGREGDIMGYGDSLPTQRETHAVDDEARKDFSDDGHALLGDDEFRKVLFSWGAHFPERDTCSTVEALREKKCKQCQGRARNEG